MFIGSSSNGEDKKIEAAYEYSLRQNTNEELDITWMRQTPIEEDFWYHENTEKWSTPFSGYRWFIPEYCNFQGRAIYTDCDMINFRDISDLYNIDLEGRPIAARRGKRFGGHEFCVMVIDNAKMERHSIPVSRQKSISEYHHRMIHKFSGNDELVQELDPRWNCLDGEEYPIDEIWQLHYTNMATQPWRPEWYVGPTNEHPRDDIVKVFHDKLDEALEDNPLCLYQPDSNQQIQDYGIIGQ